MKWKKLLHKQNARHFAWPEGWDPAEVIAEQLECSPERVREHLAPSIRSGEVEVKQFSVWDSDTGRKVVKTGFRIAGRKAESEKLKAQKPSSLVSRPSTQRSDRWPFSEGARVKRMDSPRIGVVRAGNIAWEDGRISAPSRSQQQKLRLAGK